MNRMNTRVLLPGATALLGLFWAVVGVAQYGWWVDGRPTSGFFPVIVGVLLAAVSILAVVNEFRHERPLFAVSHLYPVLAAVGVVLGALLIGFFPALTLYTFLWLKLYERYDTRFSLLTTAVTIGAMYGVFSLWLRVPFPRGLIIDLVVR